MTKKLNEPRYNRTYKNNITNSNTRTNLSRPLPSNSQRCKQKLLSGNEFSTYK